MSLKQKYFAQLVPTGEHTESLIRAAYTQGMGYVNFHDLSRKRVNNKYNRSILCDKKQRC